MSRFLVGIARLGNDVHLNCFMDHVKSVAAALRALGHEVEYASEDAMKNRPGRLIMWGANKYDASGHDFERFADTIVYQTEQVSAIKDPKFFIQGWKSLQKFDVWDYSQSNVETLNKIGLDKVVHAPLGYHPSMETIKAVPYQDIDVLFYGSSGGARRDVLNALDGAGLNVVRLFGQYGAERDAFIARAKVVVNLHFYANGVFEIFRCSHLFANGKAVVNEAGGCDSQLEALAQACSSYVPRDQIVDECRRLVADANARRQVEERAREEFKKYSLVDSIDKALAASQRRR